MGRKELEFYTQYLHSFFDIFFFRGEAKLTHNIRCIHSIGIRMLVGCLAFNVKVEYDKINKSAMDGALISLIDKHILEFLKSSMRLSSGPSIQTNLSRDEKKINWVGSGGISRLKNENLFNIPCQSQLLFITHFSWAWNFHISPPTLTLFEILLRFNCFFRWFLRSFLMALATPTAMLSLTRDKLFLHETSIFFFIHMLGATPLISFSIFVQIFSFSSRQTTYEFVNLDATTHVIRFTLFRKQIFRPSTALASPEKNQSNRKKIVNENFSRFHCWRRKNFFSLVFLSLKNSRLIITLIPRYCPIS